MIYYIYATLLSLIAFFDITTIKKNKKLILYLVSLIIAILFAGLRYKTGTDYNTYEIYFSNSLKYGFDMYYEPGFIFLVQLFSLLSDNYQFFMFMFTLLSLSLLAYILHKLTPYWLISFIIYAISLLPNNQMGSIRFGFATIITLFSIKYIIDKKFINFFLIIFLASLFHRSAIVFVLVYFIANINLKAWQYIIIFLLSIIIGYSNVIGQFMLFILDFSRSSFPFLSIINSKLNNYLTVNLEGTITLASLIKKSLLFIILMYFKTKVEKHYSWYNQYFNILLFGYILYFIFVHSFPTFAIRLASLFSIYEILLLPLIFMYIKSYTNKILLFIFIIFIINGKFLSTLVAWEELFFPYRSVFELIL